jgi:hypothetical protein
MREWLLGMKRELVPKNVQRPRLSGNADVAVEMREYLDGRSAAVALGSTCCECHVTCSSDERSVRFSRPRCAIAHRP